MHLLFCVTLVVINVILIHGSLLHALFDSDDSLLLDEQKSRDIEKEWTKKKGQESGNRGHAFLDIGHDYDDQNIHGQERVPDTGDEINTQQRPEQTAQERLPNNNRQPVNPKDDTNVRTIFSETEAEQTKCPDDVPTYRYYGRPDECGPPLQTEMNTDKPTSAKPQIQEKPHPDNSHLSNYIAATIHKEGNPFLAQGLHGRQRLGDAQQHTTTTNVSKPNREQIGHTLQDMIETQRGQSSQNVNTQSNSGRFTTQERNSTSKQIGNTGQIPQVQMDYDSYEYPDGIKPESDDRNEQQTLDKHEQQLQTDDHQQRRPGGQHDWLQQQQQQQQIGSGVISQQRESFDQQSRNDQQQHPQRQKELTDEQQTQTYNQQHRIPAHQYGDVQQQHGLNKDQTRLSHSQTQLTDGDQRQIYTPQTDQQPKNDPQKFYGFADYYSDELDTMFDQQFTILNGQQRPKDKLRPVTQQEQTRHDEKPQRHKDVDQEFDDEYHRKQEQSSDFDEGFHDQQRQQQHLGNTNDDRIYFPGQDPWSPPKPAEDDYQHKPEAEFTCRGRRAGFYPNYDDLCRSFYRCVHGDYRVYEFRCGKGTLFDSKISKCNHQKLVAC